MPTAPGSGPGPATAPVPDTPVPDTPVPATRWRDELATRALLVDLCAVLVAVALGYVLRFDRAVSVDLFQPRGGQYVLVSVVLGEAWVIALGLAGARSPRILGAGREEHLRVARGTVALFGVLTVSCYVLKIDLARSYVGVALPAGLVLLGLGRCLLARHLYAARRAGRFRRRTIIVGAPDAVADLGRRIRRTERAGFEVIGVCVNGPHVSVDGMPVLGTVAEAAVVARRAAADAVAVTASDEATPQALKQLAWDLEPTGAELVVVSGLADVAGPRLVTTPVDGVPVFEVSHPGYSGGQHVAKRLFDVIGSALLLAIVGLPLLCVAAAIRLTSPGPALFRQQRIGLHGEPFTLYKLRTMRVGAERDLAQALDGRIGLYYKPKSDARVTRLGRVLRRYSIDELPQLVNVVKGDMSLVGPRPQVALEVAQYDDAVRRRLLVKPGLTGLWQVSGRNNLPVDQSVRLDLYYVENWTLLGDIQILAHTARAVLLPDGAY